jgi:predicted YcjX-like family ATPase
VAFIKTLAKVSGWQATENSLYWNTHGGVVNLAVTGLSRAGKTVFITSVLANLLAAGSHTRNVRAQKRLKGLVVADEGRIKFSNLVKSHPRGPARFPFEANAKAIESAKRQWPARTAAVSEISVEIEFWANKIELGEEERVKTDKIAKLRLNLLDYPGEWLADLPMLGQTYAEWSTQTLQLLEEKPRNILSKPWKVWVSNLSNGISSSDEAKEGAILWQEFLCACREAKLCFLQPSRFIRSENDIEDFSKPEIDDSLAFYPMEKPCEAIEKTHRYYILEKRFNKYRDTVVAEFYEHILSKYTRQIVLVDILGALTGGEDVFNDTKRTLMAISKTMTDKSSDWLNRLKNFKLSSMTERLIFVATKADHLEVVQHDTLKNLLGSMLYDPERSFEKTAKLASYMKIASVQCTREGIDGAVNMIYGFVDGQDKPIGVVNPPIPSTDLSPEWWEKQTAGGRKPFDMPSFQPPKIEDYKTNGIPCTYLGELLQALLGDKLR